ncbi:hypothetical protein [Rhodothermus profundi]|nr:hypothetical protein [Rhodothermus profundi]
MHPLARTDLPAMEGPAFVPAYNRPRQPGIWMNFDNTVSIYHVVEPDDTFEEAAQALFALLREAQERFPDWPRLLFIDIIGHEGDRAGFDDDFFEFQQEFLFATLAPFVTALDTPLTGPLLNPAPQRNDLPDRLVIRTPGTE